MNNESDSSIPRSLADWQGTLLELRQRGYEQPSMGFTVFSYILWLVAGLCFAYGFLSEDGSTSVSNLEPLFRRNAVITLGGFACVAGIVLYGIGEILNMLDKLGANLIAAQKVAAEGAAAAITPEARAS